MHRHALACAAATLLATCTHSDDPAADEAVGVRVHTLYSPTEGDCVSFNWTAPLEPGTLPVSMPEPRIVTFGSLSDRDGNNSRELVLPPDGGTFPFGERVKVDIEILQDPCDSLNVVARGSTGWMVLERGERRYVDLALYPTVLDGSSTELENGDQPSPRFLHSSTTLDDGRILIAGGFTSLTAAECPTGSPSAASCHLAEATSDAWIFDPATGRFHQVQAGGMRVARGGHTATISTTEAQCPRASGCDGLVLVAGGAERALILTLPAPDSMTGAATIDIFPRDAQGAEHAHATYEVFDPFQPREAPENDVDGDGDPGRGLFVGGFGATSTGQPGPLNNERFLHTAAQRPNEGDQIILVGGRGDGAASSWEVFDFRKPGGYGVYVNSSNDLGINRIWAGSVGLETSGEDQVWVFGGAVSNSDVDLAQVWTPVPDSPNGRFVAATVHNANFPGVEEQPALSLLAPEAVSFIQDGERRLGVVMGWYGPRCSPGVEGVEVYPGGNTVEFCNHSNRRNFTVSALTGQTRTFGQESSLHAFGAIVRYRSLVAGIGGAFQKRVEANPFVTGLVGIGPTGDAQSEMRFGSLTRARMLHRASATQEGVVLITGGLTIDTGNGTARLVDAHEAFAFTL